jgi:mRNA-degrading endonuclease RelE of RelBE toxin-antitoxin system
MAKYLVFTRNFKKNYKRLPSEIQIRFNKQLVFFTENSSHPSLKIHRYKTEKNVWEGYITDKYRFTFSIASNEFIFKATGSDLEL